MVADVVFPQSSENQPERIRLTHFRNLSELESGVYWPQLQPYFMKPQFRRLTYRLTGRVPNGREQEQVLSTRGASGLGVLDVAYVKDRYSTAMSIGDPGLPDYCLTSVSQGALAYVAPGARRDGDSDRTTGLIYRGLPGTRLSATDDHVRMAIWIPAPSLKERLAALLGEPGKDDIVFDPFIDWESGPGQGIRRLIWLLAEELASPNSFAANDMACRSFTDLLLYTLLRSQPNNYSMQLARPGQCPVPRIIRRAEEYIQARAGQPIALHEVADAAGCSVRSLQLGFRQFRDMTPAAAIRKARLEAVQRILVFGECGRTVTDIAYQYGFTNPGRFAGLYKRMFGVSPSNDLRRNPFRRPG
ncbi:AraC-like DNA-binding protein [Roseiarcus fermentans]|uniref:AraC-like DNA-binding protein n=1 Tax=Roseiarcus fermentans TaxID=1473586 RepID=A0A366FM83_9HYPH|nr:AraC family transcriptional regulator [Roseiarcus fermentans]RBP15813.1 AraC-like DNA-binding protein [Roseiarcus fermentans]